MPRPLGGRAESVAELRLGRSWTRGDASRRTTTSALIRLTSDLARIGLTGLVGAALLAGFATFRIWQQGERDEQRPAGAIVVLGAAQYGGLPSPVFAARLDHAVELYKAQIAPFLVVTGGGATGDRTTEAAVAREYAVERGVPASAILLENQGRTTLESLGSVAAILRGRGIEDAVFVSDRTHMLRVLRIAEDEGIVAWGSPTRTSPTDTDSGRRLDATVHELGALALYLLTGQAPAGELGQPGR
ncbi:MAG TPA: YdcF family protein [Candidatus Limnocylindrales bacterium]